MGRRRLPNMLSVLGERAVSGAEEGAHGTSKGEEEQTESGEEWSRSLTYIKASQCSAGREPVGARVAWLYG